MRCFLVKVFAKINSCMKGVLQTNLSTVTRFFCFGDFIKHSVVRGREDCSCRKKAEWKGVGSPGRTTDDADVKGSNLPVRDGTKI